MNQLKVSEDLMSRILIKAHTLFNGIGKTDNSMIVIEGDKISDVTASSTGADFEGFVTPAIIDAHSHIGMYRAGEPDSEGEGNDTSDQITPSFNPLNSIYFDDNAFKEAVDFGVLYSCVVPGSGNLLGGRASVIRNFAANRGEALVKDYGFKMALGYNPRSTGEWKGTRPSTRMGVYSLLERRFDAVLTKKAKADISRERKLAECEEKKDLSSEKIDRSRVLIDREYDLEFDEDDRLLLELLSGKKAAKVHVHKEDDVLYLIGLAKKYNMRVTADHTSDVHHSEIFDALADAGIPVVYGPLGSHPYKTELKNERHLNMRQLMNSRAQYGLMTDHPVIMAQTLRETLKYFLIAGMPDYEAIGLITRRNADILGIGGDLGTVEPGKLASLVVWSGNPLYLGSFPVCVIAEGKIVRSVNA
jgi:imidazolonepropionase-like amidohydrolase